VAALMRTAGVHLGVGEQSDVEQVRREARLLASGLDFDRESCEAIALAVSELASNLVRYATGGEIDVTSIIGPRGIGIQIESLDRGPGISDIDAALSDGFSTSGGLGGGLGSVRRLLDDFEITPGMAGMLVVCRKWRQTT
jgi:serine/threonine-protein kinase RsbT